jgi:hypothetical protein
MKAGHFTCDLPGNPDRATARPGGQTALWFAHPEMATSVLLVGK